MQTLLRFGLWYSVHYRLTSILLLGSAVGVGVLLPIGWSLYRGRSVRVTVAVVSLGEQPGVKAVAVHVQRGESGTDELEVLVSVQPVVATGATTLAISVSRSLAYVGPREIAGLWTVQARPGPDGLTDYHVRSLSKGARSECRLSFRGVVFPRQPTLDTKFVIASGHNGVGLDLPTELTVANLDAVTIDQLIPQPERRTAGFIGYSAKSWIEKTGDGTVTLRGTDRIEIVRYQFRLFMVGAVLGILASLIANGVNTFLLEYDRSAHGFLRLQSDSAREPALPGRSLQPPAEGRDR